MADKTVFIARPGELTITISRIFDAPRESMDRLAELLGSMERVGVHVRRK